MWSVVVLGLLELGVLLVGLVGVVVGWLLAALEGGVAKLELEEGLGELPADTFGWNFSYFLMVSKCMYLKQPPSPYLQ